MKKEEHYLKQELYNLVQRNPAIFEFLQNGSLDGIWYWDLEKQEHEWMSPRFWTNFGYDPKKKKHLSSEWQDMIFQEDLPICIDNFKKHCENPEHPYDQIVRYKKKDGSTAWVRCRGLAIRDDNGKPTRMLGAHTDITELKQTEQALKEKVEELEIVNTTMTDRELKMIEMKKEINALRKELGKEPTYNI